MHPCPSWSPHTPNWGVANWQPQIDHIIVVMTLSCSRALRPLRSWSQNTKHFDSVLRNARDMAIWNFVTVTLWPDFLGQDQGHWHHFGIFIHFPHWGLPTNRKSASQHFELISLHTDTRAHHHRTAEASRDGSDLYTLSIIRFAWNSAVNTIDVESSKLTPIIQL